MAMGTITTSDGTEIFYKDWGSGQPIVFSHGWPLCADDWDNQMLYFLNRATASSPTTGAATAARRRPAMATTWTTTPTTWPR
jgi:pimeloyl-ACP methyl ester carboxylesterase